MLTGFQLRAALGVIRLPNSQLAESFEIHRGTLGLLKRTADEEYVWCYKKKVVMVIENFFTQRNLTFPNDYTICLKENASNQQGDGGSSSGSDSSKLSVFQLRAARAALCLNQPQLGKLVGISTLTISQLERQELTSYIDSLEINEILKPFFVAKGLGFDHKFSISLNYSAKHSTTKQRLPIKK